MRDRVIFKIQIKGFSKSPSVMDPMMDSAKKKWIFGGNHQVSLDQ